MSGVDQIGYDIKSCISSEVWPETSQWKESVDLKQQQESEFCLRGEFRRQAFALGGFCPPDLLLLYSIQYLQWSISESFKIFLMFCILWQALVMQTHPAPFIYWYSQCPLEILISNLTNFSSFKTHLRVYSLQPLSQILNIGNVSSPSTSAPCV